MPDRGGQDGEMILCVNRLEQTMLDVKKVHSVRTKRNTLSLSLSLNINKLYTLFRP